MEDLEKNTHIIDSSSMETKESAEQNSVPANSPSDLTESGSESVHSIADADNSNIPSDLTESGSESVHSIADADNSSISSDSSASDEPAESPDDNPQTSADNAEGIPCPANGDFIVFTNDITAYTQNSGRKCLRKDLNENAFSILECENDALCFVIASPDCPKPVVISLDTILPGFDSIFLWSGLDEEKHKWLICVHLPIYGRKPISSWADEFIYPASFEGNLSDTVVQAYDLTNVTTLRSWREEQSFVSPSVLYDIIERIASVLDHIFQHGHSLMRISENTVVFQNNKIQFMGVIALDMPWNERCALAHHQVEYAAVPPECFGFLRQRISQAMVVYVIGVLAYYLVAGSRIPTCEALEYAIALEPRIFNPEFPIGWDCAIHKALTPNPEFRQSCISEFIQDLQHGLDYMYERRDFIGPLTYDAAIDTHIGVTKRLRCPVNQDAVFMRISSSGQRILMVVADGVSTSTYGSGDIASHIVTAQAEKAWNERLQNAESFDSAKEISQILENSNEDICNYIREKFADKSPMSSECMGTTALVAIIENGIMTLASIGDSRAYLIRKDSMTCITRDHNLFTIGILNGLPVEICASHPHAGSLVQCLGYYNEDEQSPGLAFDIYSLHLIPGDILMLTTDGILDYVACDLASSESQIADIVRTAPNSTIACLQLIMQANIGGGGDNCGVGIIHVNAG